MKETLARILAFSAVRNLRILHRAWGLNEVFVLVFNMFLKFQVIINENSEQFDLSGVVNLSSIDIFD